MSVIIGIFVGGTSSRMGTPKGLLSHPRGGLLIEHAVENSFRLGLECVLVGASDAYAGHVAHVQRISDEVSGIGPIGGLAALLTWAGSRTSISLACDMPYVDAETVAELLRHETEADVVAARGNRSLEPMLARWRSPVVLPKVRAAIAAKQHSLQRLLEGLGAASFVPSRAHATIDWDTPEDIGR